MIRSAKRSYVVRVFEDAGDQAQFWRSRNGDRVGVPDIVGLDGQKAASPAEKADSLADQFETVWSNVTNNSYVLDPEPVPLASFIDVNALSPS